MRVLAVLLLVFVSVPLWGQVLVLQPPDLNPGDKYRLMFLTSELRDGTSSDIDDYNEFVQRLADASPVVGSWDLEWKAVASTETVDARDNTGTNPRVEIGIPIYGVHSAILAPDYDTLWRPSDNVSQQFSINVTELGTAHGLIDPDDDALFAWTGTRRDGTADKLESRGRFIGFLGSELPAVGRAASFAPALFFNDRLHSSRELPLFAMSEVLTAVPEPSNQAVFPVCMLAMLGARQRWRLQSVRRAA